MYLLRTDGFDLLHTKIIRSRSLTTDQHFASFGVQSDRAGRTSDLPKQFRVNLSRHFPASSH